MAKQVSLVQKELKIKADVLAGNMETIEKKNIMLSRTKTVLTNMMKELEIERRKLEEQKSELKKANLELDSFVYTASHDLRAPLRGISSFAGFLGDEYGDKLDEEGKRYITKITNASHRLSDLIDDLLALSRISRIRNPFEEVHINNIIDSVKNRLEFDLEEYKVELKVQDNMPVIKCDRVKLEEVFLNLINNAIKFSSKENKVNPKVQIGYNDIKDFHEFTVKDNGIGIDPQFHEQVFKIFTRLHKRDAYEGTGAGLSIVQRVVADHGGKIRIDSKEGEGATFIFTIPKVIGVKRKIGEILIEDGLITEEQLDGELKKQEERKDPPNA